MRQLHTRLLLFYTTLSLLFTWPLTRYFTTHMPGNGIDDPALGWNLWWIKTRLVDQLNLDIFHVDWMFHPIQINLAFYTLTPLNGLISIPLQSAFGLIVANNLLLLSSFVLSGYGVFLLVRNEIGARPEGTREDRSYSPLATRPSRVPSGRAAHHPPLFAGIVYAFAANKLFYAALGQYNIASSQWIPFCVLYVLRMGRSPTRRAALRNAALASLFLTLQAWAELTYASFLLLFIAIYFCWLLIAHLRSQFAIHHSPFTIHHSPFAILPFLLPALFALLGLTPFLWAMLPDLRREGDFFTSGGGFSDVFSADLAGYLVPTRLHWLLGEWVSKLPFPNDVGQQVYIGYVAVGLALVTLVYTKRHSPFAIRHSPFSIHHSPLFWLATTLFFWWMTLGPRVRWLGQETAIPGPFALISLLPFFNGNRYPSRYSVMVLLGVAVLSGIGLLGIGHWRLARQRNRQLPISTLLFGVLLIGFAAEHLSLPLPVQDFRVPEIYRKLAAVPGDFTLLELPTGWRNGARVLGKSDKLIMLQQWYQTVHGKRRLGGNTSRNPPYKFQYFTEAPLLGDLIALMNADPNAPPPNNALARAIAPQLDGMIQRDQAIATQVLALLGVQYVTVHVEKATPALLRFVEEALPLILVDTWQGNDWAGEPSTIRLYQVEQQTSPTTWAVNLASPLGNLYLAEGWSPLLAPAVNARFATRRQAELLLDLPAQGGGLEMELFGPNSNELQLAVNGHWLNPAEFQWVKTDCLLAPLAVKPAPDSPLPAPATNPRPDLWKTPCLLAVDIPTALVMTGLDRLTLHFAPTAPPIDALTQSQPAEPAPIGQTGVSLSPGHTLVVESAGLDVGNFAHISLDGQELAQQQRGYNLVALAPAPQEATGYQLLDSAAFDTHSGPAPSAAMTAWLQRWPPGTIIAGAVQDEASLHLEQNAINALAELGVATDLRREFRASHAFIGVVSAPPGSALEEVSVIHPARVHVGGVGVFGGVGRVQTRFTLEALNRLYELQRLAG